MSLNGHRPDENFGKLSGFYRLTDISITARRYCTLSEQSFVFLSISLMLSFSLYLPTATATSFLSQIHHFSCHFHQFDALKTIIIIFSTFLTVKTDFLLKIGEIPIFKP